MFKIILLFVLSLFSFSFSVNLVEGNEKKQISKIAVKGIDYIKLSDIKKSISTSSIWFGDRNKLILTLKNSEKIIFSIDNRFVAYNGKNYNLIYNIIRDENGEILVPYITFINLLPNLFGDVVKFDKKLSTITFLFQDTTIFDASYENKDNGTIIKVAIPEKTLFDYTNVNNSLNLNFYDKTINEKFIKKNLSNKIERVKDIRIFNFDKSSQLTFVFKTLKEKPKVFFTKDDNTINIIIRSKKANYSNKIKTPQKVIKKEDKKEKIEISLEKKAKQPFTVVIDAGHGGKDPGAIGYNGTQEKRIVLDVAKRLKTTFKKDKIKVLLTRDKDEFLRLKQRADIANKNHADLFISLHCNAIGGSKKRREGVLGFTTYFLSPARTNEARAVEMFENGALKYEEDEEDEENNDLDFIVNDVIQTKFLDESNYISEQIFNSMNKNGIKKVHGTGISQAGFYVLRKAFMPAILFEMGFISNPAEEKLLNSTKHKEKIAKSLHDAIIKYKEKYYEQ